MDPQLQEMQKQIAALVTAVEVLRATCATKDDINEIKRELAGCATKDDIDEVKHEIAEVNRELDKVNTRLDGVNIRLDAELPHLARKAETEAVRSETRSWVLGVLLIILGMLFSAQFAAYRMLDDSFSLKIAAALRAAPPPPTKN